MTNSAHSSSSVLTAEQLDALVQGNYQDIFSVLGLHPTAGGKGITIRTLLPWADTVDVIATKTGKKVTSLNKVHDGGVFEKSLGNRKHAFDYKLRVNNDIELEDHYRFPSLISSDELYLFGEGTAEHCYRWLGANPRQCNGIDGVLFAVWAPSAQRVSVVGDFNGWDGRQHVMRLHFGSGVWELFIPHIVHGAHYKFEIIDGQGARLPLRADPYAKSMQHPPQTASTVVLEQDFQWRDDAWMNNRRARDSMREPVSIYEVHAGSWRRKQNEDNRYYSYQELAQELVPYVKELGYTHIQLMPISEYPFDGSWGYQPVGLYAPSIRFGTPAEFKEFVSTCHEQGIGVLLDWVPGHFPTDEHGLGRFDGTCLYEHEDVRKGYHPDWNTLIYNYSRAEVVSFLLSNANYWIEEFHIDGLRVDAVASMLYLDYSREEGQWIPNEHGGRENLEAISLLQSVNTRLYDRHPGIMMIAEESTSWGGVSHPVDGGGLGFGYKWNMGWMNDSLVYMGKDPIYRSHHHGEMTFATVYAWSENFILPISHDEVVHGKGSLLQKMPGDDWQQFANVRAFLGFMWAFPGKKLLFMGSEFAQRQEWNHDQELDWFLLDSNAHRGVQHLVKDLNRVYKQLPPLFEQDHNPEGFRWVQSDNGDLSLFSWLRFAQNGDHHTLVITNMTPQTHNKYRLGVPAAGYYEEAVNTDAADYGGSGQGNCGGVQSEDTPWDNLPCSVELTIPPLSTVILEYKGA